MSKRLVHLAILMTAVTLLPNVAQAQTPATFGLKAGVTNSTLSADDALGLDLSSIWGAAGGLFMVKNMNDRFGLQIEALVAQRGAQDDTFAISTKTRLTYLDIPVTVRVGSTTTNDVHFHAFTGPQIGFKLKAEGSSDIFGNLDIGNEIKSTDFGWTVGAGVEKGPVSLDARFTIGLTDIDAASSDGPLKNRAFMVLVGYRFR